MDHNSVLMERESRAKVETISLVCVSYERRARTALLLHFLSSSLMYSAAVLNPETPRAAGEAMRTTLFVYIYPPKGVPLPFAVSRVVLVPHLYVHA